MKANIGKTFEVEHPVDKVWSFLSNPNKIVTCVPGASITEQVDDENYKGQVSMKFGPVAVKYNGEIAIQEMDHDNHVMILKGRGLDAKGKGSADMVMNGRLAPTGNGGTEVQYNMEVAITGMLAQFGSRLITDVSNQVVDQFIGNFKSKLNDDGDGSAETAAPAQGNSINAASLMGSVVKNKISGVFKGKKKEAGEEEK